MTTDPRVKVVAEALDFLYGTDDLIPNWTGVPSGGSTARTLEEGREAMGIGWMSWSALVEAIPPAYTAFIGAQLLDHIGRAAA